MKSIAKVCLAVVTALTLAAYTAHAQADSTPISTTSTNKPVSAKPKSRGKPYSGTIDSVDNDGKTITVLSTSGTSKTYKVTSKTRIKKDGEPATLADLSKGEKVRGVSHETDSGDLVASTVNVGQMKKPSAPAATAPAAPDTTK